MNDKEKATFLQGEPIAELFTADAPKGSMKEVTEQVGRLFDSFGNIARHPEIGAVTLDRRSVKNSLGHGRGRFKETAFLAVKDVVERGAIVCMARHTTDEGRHKNIVSMYISAPLLIDNKQHIVTVLVRKDNNRERMYLHSVIQTKMLLSRRLSRTDPGRGERSGPYASGATVRLTPKSEKINQNLIFPGVKQGKATSAESTTD